MLAYNGRNKRGEWGLSLGAQDQSLIIDIIGMSFIPLYKFIGSFIFFVSLLLMAWGEGGLRLIVTIFLRIAIILRYRGWGVWILASFWGMLF